MIIILGHASRGHSILEVTDQFVETLDDLPYLTLSYANGPGPWVDPETGKRRNVTSDDFHAIDYKVAAAVPRRSETHGGDDVLIYAKGPFAHLLSGTHQQSYIPHVVWYAACIGPGAKHCDNHPGFDGAHGVHMNKSLSLMSILFIIFFSRVI